MQGSDRTEVPAQIHSDTVQASLKIYWIRRCQFPVKTEHWHPSFSFLVHLCEIRVDSVGRGRIMFAPSLLWAQPVLLRIAGAASVSGGKNALATVESAVVHYPAGAPAMQVSLHGMKRNVSDLRLQLHQMKQLQVWLSGWCWEKRWFVSKCLFTPSLSLVFSLLAFVQVVSVAEF